MIDKDSCSGFQFSEEQRAVILKRFRIGTLSERAAFLDSAEQLVQFYGRRDPGPLLDVQVYRKAAEDVRSAASKLATLLESPIHKILDELSEEETEDLLTQLIQLIQLYDNREPRPVLDVQTCRKSAKDLLAAASKLATLLESPIHQILNGLPDEETEDLVGKLVWIQNTSQDNLNQLKSYRHEHAGKPLLQALAKRWEEIFRRRPGHGERSQFATVINDLRDNGGLDLPTVTKRVLQ